MRAVFEAVDGGHINQAAQLVNDLLRTTGARPQLDRVDGEPWQVHFHGSDDTLSVGWSAGCATALALAAHVLTHLDGVVAVCEEIGSVLHALIATSDPELVPNLRQACEGAAKAGCPDALTWAKELPR
ncbi:hypothetical protein GQF42_00980 [Streptomyces broussonetiae]|uniref:Uncharacterized protein n=2 Tax=Streptomyces broussonetiae TaxID=2686304 RepID=A0A6I6N1S4_9ACTN|nr:ABATE domain-containing protein [Streptomyces broussonetiae]QHA02116.1 hypothetical protein GQF42_00980 [Streptomyces broussonetiae]